MSLHLPGSLGKSKPKAVRGAQLFADVLSRVLNCTVSRAPVRAAITGQDPFEGYIALLGEGRLPSLAPLTNGGFLYLQHHFCLAEKGKDKFLATAHYTYTYQLGSTDDTWVIRWEYNREPGKEYRYPHAHVHVNACPAHYTGQKAFPELHIPTARVTLESVVRHLIVEHDIPPISDNWQQILGETQADFERIQRLR